MLLAQDIERYGNGLLKEIARRDDPFKPLIFYETPGDLNDIHNKGIRGDYAVKSIYAKRMESSISGINRLSKDIESEIRETKTRIKKLQQSPNGVKYEVELRNLVSSLLTAKLNALKTNADLITKIDKADKEDRKMALALTGGATETLSNLSGDTNSYMAKMMNSNAFDSPNASLYAKLGSFTPGMTQPVPQPIKKIDPSSVLEPPIVKNDVYQPLPIHEETKLELPPIEPVVEPVIAPTIEETNTGMEPEPLPEVDNNGSVIQNALGVPVELYSEGGLDIDKFNTTLQDDLSMERAYINLMASANPNVVKFFKYNKEEGIGYLVACDTETKEEIPGVTVLPISLLYPWVIDTQNHVVSTYINENFPILYTTDPTPEHIRREFEIVANRENGTIYDELEEDSE